MQDTASMLVMAFWIMIFGMAIVYIFLSVMIIAVHLTGKIFARVKDQPDRLSGNQEKNGENSTDNKGKMAAISAAVKMYRDGK